MNVWLRLLAVLTVFLLSFPESRANPTPCGNSEDLNLQINCFTNWINAGRVSGDDLAFTLTERAAAFSNKRNYNLAISDYNRAIELYFSPHQKNPNYDRWRWRAICSRGNVYEEKGDFDRAIADYFQCLQDPSPDADTADIHFFLGRAYYKKGDLGKALPELHISWSQFPMDRTKDLLDQINKEQVQTRQNADNAFDSIYRNCTNNYRIDACDLALKNPIANADQLAALEQSREIVRRFHNDLNACKTGSSAACEVSLLSPAATQSDRDYINHWRSTLSPSNRLMATISATFAAILFSLNKIPLSTYIFGVLSVILAGTLIFVARRYRSPPPIDSEALQKSLTKPVIETFDVPDRKLKTEKLAPQKDDKIESQLNMTPAVNSGAQTIAVDRADRAKTPGPAFGFGIAALVFAFLAIIFPFGIILSVIAIALSVIAALFGDKIFSVATALIALVNTFVLSPSTWILLSGDPYGFLKFGLAVVCLLPMITVFLRAILPRLVSP